MIDDTSLESIDQAIRTRLAELEGTHETIVSVQSNFTNATIRVWLRDAMTKRAAEFSISEHELWAVAANGKHLDQMLADLVFAAVEGLQQRTPRPKPPLVVVPWQPITPFANIGSMAAPGWEPMMPVGPMGSDVLIGVGAGLNTLVEEIRARVDTERVTWGIPDPVYVKVEPIASGWMCTLRASSMSTADPCVFTLTPKQLRSPERRTHLLVGISQAMLKIRVHFDRQKHTPEPAPVLVIATGRPPRAMTLDDE